MGYDLMQFLEGDLGGMMEGVALSLGLPAAYFHDRYTADPTVLFRIFHYPATPPADGGRRRWPARSPPPW